MLKTYTFPRALTNKFVSFEEIVVVETSNLVQRLSLSNQPTEIKPFILKSCANMFTNHFCSKSFAYDDACFNRMVENFDEIFYEINQGYAADFLPFLLPLHQRRLKKMSGYAHEIRDFINDNIIKNR